MACALPSGPSADISTTFGLSRCNTARYPEASPALKTVMPRVCGFHDRPYRLCLAAFLAPFLRLPKASVTVITLAATSPFNNFGVARDRANHHFGFLAAGLSKKSGEAKIKMAKKCKSH